MSGKIDTSEKAQLKLLGNTAVVVLSAGYSSRMGDFKPLMPFGETTVIEYILKQIKIVSPKETIVVTGYNRDRLVPALKDELTVEVYNHDFDKGMFSSIQAGFSYLLDKYPADGENPLDGVFLLPVDHPAVAPVVFRKLYREHLKEKDSWVAAGYQGKKGHPLYIPYQYIDEITRYAGPGGLKGISENYRKRSKVVDVPFEGVVMDMDTKRDYEELQEYLQDLRYPTYDICLNILKSHKTPPHVIEHCKGVTDAALRMAAALNKNGCSFNMRLIQSAGLLHDIDRVKEKHWEEGAQYVKYCGGADDVSEIVRHHMQHSAAVERSLLKEIDLVCLADRMVREDQYVGIHKRMQYVLDKFNGSDDLKEILRVKFLRNQKLKHEIENTIGCTIEDIMAAPFEELVGDGVDDKGDFGIIARGRNLYLIRHGEIRQHKEKIFLGQTDVPLSERGRKTVEETAGKLKAAGASPAVVYASDLKRAVETADILAGILNGTWKDYIKEPDFREMSLGSWDGKFISEIIEKCPEKYEERGRDLVGYKTGNGSENFYDLRYRVMRRLKRILKITTGDVVIVCHGGVIKVIRSCLEKIPLDQAVKENGVRPGDFLVLEV